MIETIPNKIHIDRNWGLFIGQFNNNHPHKHYALQISIASESELEITDDQENKRTFESCFINSNVTHCFYAREISLIILINPISAIGHQLSNSYSTEDITELKTEVGIKLKSVFDDYLNAKIQFQELVKDINACLTNFKCSCELENHVQDDRIYKAIQHLEQNFERIVSLKEIAEFSFLSETRFQHLFKEKTRLNFRRYQLWNKLVKSLPFLQNHSITHTAHHFGFTDSSHYTRTFKETFGLSPKILLDIK